MRKPLRRATGCDFRFLRENEQRYCDAINRRLRELEAIYHARALVLDAELERRVADPDDWLQDYEIDLMFDFQLREDDPGFREDSDNYIASIRFPMKQSEAKPEYGIGALDYHHNDSTFEITDLPHPD